MPENRAENPVPPMSRRIHEAYSELPDSERRIAEAILSSPGELAVLNASELALQAGVSNATVSRFFRRLGYANFEAARRDARRMRAMGSPLFTGSDTGPAPDKIAAVIAAEIAVMQATLTRLNPITLSEIATALAGAGAVRTLGYRNSHFLAQYLAAQLAQVRPNVAPLLAPGQTRGEALAGLGPRDIVVVVGLRRRPANFEQTVEAIATSGARVVLLADPTIRGAPAFANWTLDCVVGSPQVADSYSGALAILRLLFMETRRALGEAGRRYLEEIEELHATLNALE